MGPVLALGFVTAGCGVGDAEVQVSSESLVGADETGGLDSLGAALTAAVPAGAALVATANLNLRTGPSTQFPVHHVIPKGARVTAAGGSPRDGWYALSHNGVSGWCFGAYLAPAEAGVPSQPSPAAAPASSSARDAAMSRARSGVGFSYWWGHGRWQPSGPSASSQGSCTGSCPSCSHGGQNGADCSGYVAKVWQAPTSNEDVTVDSHPYSTWDFDNSSTGWHTVATAALQAGDALVYNSNGAGHVFIFDSIDGWGSTWAYEAKGCAYGIVHDLRGVSAAYKGIARDGY